MNLFGKEPQEQSMQTLIHDTNRDLAQLDHVINKLADWLKENCKKMSESEINTSYPFVALEYLKTSSKNIKKDIDNYYVDFVNDFNKK